MADTQQGIAGEIARKARDVATLVIAQLWPGRDFADIDQSLRRQTVRVQAELCAGVLGFLFMLALFAGQFGPLGIMLYFAAVIFTMR